LTESAKWLKIVTKLAESHSMRLVKALVFLAAWVTILNVAPSSALAQSLTQTRQFTFAGMQIPAAGSVQATLSATGAYSGTAVRLYGTRTSGAYRITRGTLGTSTITLNVTNAVSGNPNVTLSNFTGRWGTTNIATFPRSGLTRPATGAGTILQVGGRLTYNSSVTPGPLTITFDIVLTQP
jgi:hypothetical protein